MTKDQVQQLMKGRFEAHSFEPEIIETHISWVIFTEYYAFKIKKPEKFSFLDFSSIARRKHFCEEEIRLNSRLSDIYLDVLRIRETDSGLSLENNSGNVIDYAVQMKKLPASCKMDEMLKQNQVEKLHIVKLANLVSRFHQNAEVVRPQMDLEKLREDFNDIASYRNWVAKNLNSTAADAIPQAIGFSDDFLSKHAKLLKTRVDEDFVRDVHGDLHSGNIFLPDPPVILDCIEFNPAFRQIDLIDELAFFCMDLEAAGCDELSKAFLAQYQHHFQVIRNSRV